MVVQLNLVLDSRYFLNAVIVDTARNAYFSSCMVVGTSIQNNHAFVMITLICSNLGFAEAS